MLSLQEAFSFSPLLFNYPPFFLPPHSQLQQHHQLQFRTRKAAPKFFCSICGNGFSRRGNLTRHLKLHSGIKPFKCAECKKTFATKGNYKTHLRVHNKPSRYYCKFCGRGYKREGYLEKHLEKHFSEDMKKKEHHSPQNAKPQPSQFSSLQNITEKGELSKNEIQTHDDKETPVKEEDNDPASTEFDSSSIKAASMAHVPDVKIMRQIPQEMVNPYSPLATWWLGITDSHLGESPNPSSCISPCTMPAEDESVSIRQQEMNANLLDKSCDIDPNITGEINFSAMHHEIEEGETLSEEDKMTWF